VGCGDVVSGEAGPGCDVDGGVDIGFDVQTAGQHWAGVAAIVFAVDFVVTRHKIHRED
jgi:hypothetical protein